MKIETYQASPLPDETGFTPVDLVVHLESYQDAVLMYRLTTYDVTIPHAVEGDGLFAACRSFLYLLRRATYPLVAPKGDEL